MTCGGLGLACSSLMTLTGTDDTLKIIIIIWSKKKTLKVLIWLTSLFVDMGVVKASRDAQ